MTMIFRSYKELIKLPTFEERLKYCMLDGAVGKSTFGYERYLNQQFYRSKEWKSIRRDVILRDEGCDLADNNYPIVGHIYVSYNSFLRYTSGNYLRDNESCSKTISN